MAATRIGFAWHAPTPKRASPDDVVTGEPTKRRLIGVLGGMGPAATIDLMAKIVRATPASSDQDHIPMIVYLAPQTPDRSISIAQSSDTPFLPLLSGVRMLDANGADFIAIPCNTAHFWHDKLARACNARIIHIADAVLSMLEKLTFTDRRVALLAMRGTLSAHIYDSRLLQAGIQAVLPDESVQILIDKCIALVKSGNVDAARHNAVAAADRLFDTRGVDRLLLACTELPIAFASTCAADRFIDATEALAQACVRASLSSWDAPK